jgi:hypothetical protein
MVMPKPEPEPKTNDVPERHLTKRSKPKREARAGFLEAVADGDKFLILIVFRGGWLDGVVMKRGLEGLEEWLGTSGFFEELSGFALGNGIIQMLGSARQRELASWLEAKGKRLIKMPPRNARQVKVIVEGVKSYIEGKP